jgi:hypothetical protein
MGDLLQYFFFSPQRIIWIILGGLLFFILATTLGHGSRYQNSDRERMRQWNKL